MILPRPLRSIALFPLLALSACGSKGPEDDVAAVKACYEEYFAALREGDGAKAASLVDSRTADYYARMLDLARNADSTEVATLDLMDKATVLGMRLSGTPDALRTMDGRSALAFAVDAGMMNSSGLEDLGIGTVEVEDDLAKASLTMHGFPVPIPASLRFQREDGRWRIGLTSLIDLSRTMMGSGVMDPATADAMLMEMLKETAGGRVPDGIWHPAR